VLVTTLGSAKRRKETVPGEPTARTAWLCTFNLSIVLPVLSGGAPLTVSMACVSSETSSFREVRQLGIMLLGADQILTRSMGDFAMFRLRVGRLLTWTVVVFLVPGVTGAGATWPKVGLKFVSPASSTIAAPALGGANHDWMELVEPAGPAFMRKDSTEQTAIASAIPDGSADQGVAAAPTVPADLGQVAENPAPPQPTAPTEGDEVPNPNTIAPVTTDSSSAIPQPVTSSEGDEVPAPLVIIPAAARRARRRRGCAS